jgi:hypothetical protein
MGIVRPDLPLTSLQRSRDMNRGSGAQRNICGASFDSGVSIMCQNACGMASYTISSDFTPALSKAR